MQKSISLKNKSSYEQSITSSAILFAESKNIFKVLVIGNKNSGKSLLISKLVVNYFFFFK